MSNSCLNCGDRFNTRKTKDRIDVFYCRDCAKKKKQIEKLNGKIQKFINKNPFKKFHITFSQDEHKNPIRLIIDFTKERK